jgi:hypothetical protein
MREVRTGKRRALQTEKVSFLRRGWKLRQERLIFLTTEGSSNRQGRQLGDPVFFARKANSVQPVSIKPDGQIGCF